MLNKILKIAGKNDIRTKVGMTLASVVVGTVIGTSVFALKNKDVNVIKMLKEEIIK